MEINVSSIQHFSVGDGPGIRTTEFLKGCNLKCPWCHNPETISGESQELLFKENNKRVTYGKKMSLEEVIGEVMEDEIFYEDGGGGVTVSGGEPLLQSRAVAELLQALKRKGISTLVDTAGCVPWEAFERVLDVTDIFYFDVKIGDSEKYASVIGGDAERIFDNLSRLQKSGCRFHVRIPLIPGFNTDDEECAKICERLNEIGVEEVHLLPFHRLGSSKYEALGKTYSYKDVSPLGKEDIGRIADIYKKHFKITIE